MTIAPLTLRPYQAEAVAAAEKHMATATEPFLIEAVTGAGKSLIIAELARRIHERSGKRVLCLAPSAELVTQNRAKFLLTGNPASMYSASAGGKDMRHPVVFGSPLTVLNNVEAFKDGFALVVIDECQGVNPTLRAIIAAMKEGNPYLRVIGLTATPYRLGSGYIYRTGPDGKAHPDDRARDPYFTHCVYRVQARDLIAQGYLTPPRIGVVGDHYDTGGMVLMPNGKFRQADVDAAYHGHGRLTAAIVADVVARSANRRGVMLFAATVEHAQEVLASLPPGLSAIVTGETPARERASILKRFLAQELKYLVNVAVLTTGFDAPHVDVIAILRKTESVGLLQQIVGRGLRLYPGKTDALILDYTTNIEDHCPDGDIFDPKIRAVPGKEAGKPVDITCPDCGAINEFSLRPDMLDVPYDDNGYALDGRGVRIAAPDEGGRKKDGMPVHFGRRCFGQLPQGDGTFDRCSYRWAGRECVVCGADNDIAARRCHSCRAEIIDPNERLRAEFKAFKKDPSHPQCDKVVSLRTASGTSAKGNPVLRVEVHTEWRTFTAWLQPAATQPKRQAEWKAWQEATNGGTRVPETIGYRKDPQSGFYRIISYNQPIDEMKEGAA